MGKADIESLRDENRRLRSLLAVHYGWPGLYMDDGELQDKRMQPFIDFKRDSVAQIESKIRERALRMLHDQMVTSQSGSAASIDRTSSHLSRSSSTVSRS